MSIPIEPRRILYFFTGLYFERTLAKESQILEVIRIACTSARMPGELTDELAETITKVIVTRDEAYQLLVHPYHRVVLEDELRSALSSIDAYEAPFYAPLVHQLGNYVIWNWKARGMVSIYQTWNPLKRADY